MSVLQKFVKYCKGEINTIPWSEVDGLQPETKTINEDLVDVNNQGFLTINSQPAVNGEKSDSPSVGTCLSCLISYCRTASVFDTQEDTVTVC